MNDQAKQTITYNLTDGMTLGFVNIKTFVVTPHDYKIFYTDGTIRLVNRMHVISVEIRGDVEMPTGPTIQ